MTTTPRLTLKELIKGLDTFGDGYHAFAVFADDVQELRVRAPLPGLGAVDAEGRRFRLAAGGKSYDVELLPERGAVVIARPPAEPAPSAEPASFGESAELAIVAAQRGKGQVAAPMLGLLLGSVIFDGLQPVARKVVTMKFDPEVGEWQVYDGGLVRWLKKQLIVPLAA